MLPTPANCPAPDVEHDFNLDRFGACPDCTAVDTRCTWHRPTGERCTLTVDHKVRCSF